MEEETPIQTPPQGAKLIFTVFILILLAVHLVAMFLWIAPSNAISNAVTKPLRAYALPVWQQSWSLFAPDPVHAAYYLEVRSVPQDLTETQWLDASATELQGLKGHLLPTTASNITNKLASGVHKAVNELTSEQNAFFTWNYHDNAWERMTADAFGEGSSANSQFVSAQKWDRAATAYATQYLQAQGVLSTTDFVQYRIVRIAAPGFDERATAENQRSVSFTSGRRPATTLPDQDQAGFQSALEKF